MLQIGWHLYCSYYCWTRCSYPASNFNTSRSSLLLLFILSSICIFFSLRFFFMHAQYVATHSINFSMFNFMVRQSYAFLVFGHPLGCLGEVVGYWSWWLFWCLVYSRCKLFPWSLVLFHGVKWLRHVLKSPLQLKVQSSYPSWWRIKIINRTFFYWNGLIPAHALVDNYQLHLLTGTRFGLLSPSHSHMKTRGITEKQNNIDHLIESGYYHTWVQT